MDSVVKLFNCEVCDQKFSLKCNLIKHIKRHSEEKPYECKICNKKLASKYYLKIHVARHSEVKAYYECDVCNRTFLRKNNFMKHSVIHLEGTPYECDECKKKFTTKHYLNMHQTLHSKENSHECKICNKKFTTKYHLNNHITLHSKENSHECKICDKKFATNGALIRHIKNVHSTEKRYKCKKCKKQFSTMSCLSFHINIHHKKKSHESELCQTKFLCKSPIIAQRVIHTVKKSLKLNNISCFESFRNFSKNSYLGKHLESLVRESEIDSISSVNGTSSVQIAEYYNEVETNKDPSSYPLNSNHRTMQLTKEIDSIVDCEIDRVKIEPVELNEYPNVETEEDPLYFPDGKDETILKIEEINSWIKCDSQDGIKEEFQETDELSNLKFNEFYNSIKSEPIFDYDEEFKGFSDESSNLKDELDNDSVKSEPILDCNELNLVPCFVLLKRIIFN